MRLDFDCETHDSVFNKFKTISFCPFELAAIDVNLLTDRQIEVLNSYHRKVFDKLSPYFSGEILDYLREATKEVSR